MNSAESIKQLLMQDIDFLIEKTELYANNEKYIPLAVDGSGFKMFTDAVIKPSRTKNEYTAICEMIDHTTKWQTVGSLFCHA